MSPDPDADLGRLRTIALALPGSQEKLSHGQPVFLIERGRLFAQWWHDHHSDGESAVMVKTSGTDEQALLIEADPARHYKPAYIGASGWIAIRVDVPAPDWDDIATRVERSWRSVAPRRLVEKR